MINNDIKTFKGYWFLPSQPKNKIAGILEINGFRTFRLDLIGGFHIDLEKILDDSKEEKVIFGFVYDEKNHFREVTLFDCYSSSNINLSADYPLIKYECNFFIDGLHLESKKSKKFHQIHADFSNLSKWKPSGVIKKSFTFQNEECKKPEKIELEINNKNNSEISVEIEKGIRIILYSSAYYHTEFDNSKFTLGQSTLLRIETDNDLSIIDLLSKLYLYKQFLSLGTLSNITYKKIWLYSKESFQLLENKEKHEHPIYLYFRYWNSDKNSKKLDSNNVIYTYSSIEKEYPEIIKKWFNTSKDFIPIRDYLIDSITPRKCFRNNDFLIIIQAIEGYHTRFIKEEKEFLANRLKFLIRDKYKNVSKISKITDDDIEVIKDSRNYYSHFYKNKKRAVSGFELFKLSEKLKCLLICCVLSLMDMDNEKINNLLNNNPNL